MINKLFFMAALLVPGLASAANPSADLSGQIVPSGPGLPAPAQAAGFTIQALNADFTVVGGPYSNTASFIDGCGATAAYRFYNRDGGNGGGGNVACSDTAITTDGGVQVLGVQAAAGATQALNFPGYYGKSDGLGFPIGTYIEVVYRSTLQSLLQDGTYPSNPVAWWRVARGVTSNGTYPPNNWIEMDLHDTITGRNQANNVAGGMIDWGTMNYGPWTQWTADQSVYNKEGVLFTTNGSSDIWKCTFWNDVFTGCVNLPGTPIAAINFIQHDNQVTLTLGQISSGYVSPILVFVKSIKVWECANWQSGQCNGTMVTHWPFP
jgi:hypothetical protein